MMAQNIYPKTKDKYYFDVSVYPPKIRENRRYYFSPGYLWLL